MSATTQQIIDRYHDSYDAGDLDQFISLYNEESIVVCGDKICRGKSEIREFFEYISPDVLPPNAEFDSIHEIIEGDIAYFVWRSRTDNVSVRIGTDTLLIRDGIIAYQTLMIDFDSGT